MLSRKVIEPFSAGIVAHGKNPNAIRVMTEAGVDISGQESKTLQSLLDRGIEFDYVITVCGHADENCPRFPHKTKVIHRGFDDPPKLAASASNEEEALDHYRRIRDEIKVFVQNFSETLNASHQGETSHVS